MPWPSPVDVVIVMSPELVTVLSPPSDEVRMPMASTYSESAVMSALLTTST
jgi:hypothetical protein